MKKSIAIVALLATSSAAHALIRPDPNPQPVRTLCLRLNQYQDGSIVTGCDEASNNKREGRQLMKNGCAAGQAALVTIRTVQVESCLPPGIAQL